MNDKQELVLKITAIILGVMLVFPPFHLVTYRGTSNEGYRFILFPPNGVATMDVGTLITQCFIVSIVGLIFFFAFKAKE